MSIRAGVIVAVAFEQVDSAPDTKTGTESDDKRLQYADCTVEKCHRLFPPLFAPLQAGNNEKALLPHVHLQEKGMKKPETDSRVSLQLCNGQYSI